MTTSEEVARHVIDQCLAVGTREFVVCAGSRNSPLVLELLRRNLRCWSFFEERSAAFFALGRTRALAAETGQRRPRTAVITTSGSAVVELFPALVEAHYLNVPLLLVTADRPQSFRGSGAPQAIEQRGVFGGYVEDCIDVIDHSFVFTQVPTRSVHLNVCLDEPLLSGVGVDPVEFGGPLLPLEQAREAISEDEVQLQGRLVVLLGAISPERRQEVQEFLREVEAPILADATSGLREDPELQSQMLKGGERVLKLRPPEVVLRIGGVPSCRFWRDLEDLKEIPVYNTLHNGFSGLARPSIEVEKLASIRCTGKGGEDLLALDAECSPRLEKLLARYPSSEPALFRLLSESIPEGAPVFLGNSLPIREWNLAATYQDRGLQPWANRGANGIDGNLSTFLGLSADTGEAWGVFGDLTTLYDLSGPWILRNLTPGKRLTVINNHGGRIFSRLPVLGELDAEKKATTENTHPIHFRAWAEMWSLSYYSVGSAPMPTPRPGENAVIEMLPNPQDTDAFWQELPSLYEGF